MSDEKQQKQETAKPTGRIPVNKIWLREMMDLPGHANVEQIDCSVTRGGRPCFTAHFVPAHQVIELEVTILNKPEPYRTRLALAFVKRFD